MARQGKGSMTKDGDGRNEFMRRGEAWLGEARLGWARQGMGSMTKGNKETKGRSMASRSIQFNVPGMAVGKSRPKLARNSDSASAYEKMDNYESFVRMVASVKMRRWRLYDCPVSLSLSICVSPPSSWPLEKQKKAKLGRLPPTTSPSVCNIIKLYRDAMTGVVWIDDKQILGINAQKYYGSTPSVEVTVREIR
jgi:Holliday junction resolvase RusA-like endonuclease